MNGDPQPADWDRAIELIGLRKHFGKVAALDGLSLAVGRGSIHGFLGPNGAGKTTTLKLVLGMARPDAGRVSLFGRGIEDENDSVAARRRIGFVSEAKEMYAHLDVEETVRFTRGFFPNWERDREAELLRRFELPSRRKVTDLSKGMRTKLALLLACCRRADLLIFDEPTDGLDPGSVEEVLETLVGEVAERETTVFFSSHQLSEVERIADHVSLVHRGRVVLDGELDTLRQRFHQVRLVIDGISALPKELLGDPAIRTSSITGRVATMLVDGDAAGVVERARLLAAVRSVETRALSLRELFLVHTKGTQ
jgi:ABC-2 type transport system ATP-binding protein